MVLSEIFCPAGPKKIRRGAFGVSYNFNYGTKTMDGNWRISGFSVEIFLTHSAKTLVGEPSNVFENLGYRTLLYKKKTYHFSPLKSFLPHSAEKKFYWNRSVLQKIPASKIFMRRKSGGITVLWKKVMSHRTKTENFLWELSCCKKNFWYRLKFYGWEEQKQNKMAMLLSETVNVSEVAKRSHTAEIRTPIYRFRTLLSQPHCLHFFFNEKLRQFWTEQKKENQP